MSELRPFESYSGQPTPTHLPLESELSGERIFPPGGALFQSRRFLGIHGSIFGGGDERGAKVKPFQGRVIMLPSGLPHL